MRCIIPSQNVKIIARGIQSLSKIGDEMFVEPTENELVFRTVNMAQSAFAEFCMTRSFFSSYIFHEEEDSEASCKITIRSCLSVFKNSHCMDKQVENCEIRTKADGTVLIFQIRFNNCHAKKHYLPVIESEKLEVGFPGDAPNNLTASAKFLSSAVKNFRYSEDEISVIVEKEKFIIKNHLEFRKDEHFMRTELTFHPTEFESYMIGKPASITFCFKELRAIMAFAEPSNLPVAMAFDSPGRPIVFKVMNQPAYKATYIVSTLNSSQSHLSNSISRKASSRNSSGSREQGSLRKRRKISSENEDVQRDPYDLSEGDQSLFSIQTGPLHVNDINESSDMQPVENCSNKVIPDSADPNDVLLNSQPNAGSAKSISGIICSEYDQLASSDFNNSLTGSKNCDNPLVEDSFRSSTNRLINSLTNPRIEFIKTIFARCYSKINVLSSLKGHSIILASDSDSELH